jgi:hypothetical protein
MKSFIKFGGQPKADTAKSILSQRIKQGSAVSKSLGRRCPLPKEHVDGEVSVACALVVGFVTSALAEQFYVAFDPASHKCTMMQNIPGGSLKDMGGSYGSKAEAKKAMAGMKECTS